MKFTVLALSVLLTVTLAAQDESEDACNGTTDNGSACLWNIYKQVDNDLNSVYRSAMKSAADYSRKDAQNLRNAQLKWIAYRDAHCDAEFGLWGNGTGGPIVHTICLTELTRTRIALLRSTYDLPN